MIKLGDIVLDGTPRIAVSADDRTSPEVLARAKRCGLDIIELRIDEFSSFESSYVLEKVTQLRDLSTIGTIRSNSDGGKWSLPEVQRLALFKVVAPEVDGIDIELSSRQILGEVVETARASGKTVIVSYHNFEHTPPYSELEDIAQAAKASGADIVKIATQCVDKGDMESLARFTLSNAEMNLVMIAMGSLGSLSRICFPAFGSLITYTFLGIPTAPGQLHFDDTLHYLRLFYPQFNQEKIRTLEIVESF